MKTVYVSKADPLIEGEDVTSVTIVIDEKIPLIDDLTEHSLWADQQAQMITNALYESLPQCTFDLVAIRMFEKKVSLYIGRIKQLKENGSNE